MITQCLGHAAYLRSLFNAAWNGVDPAPLQTETLTLRALLTLTREIQRALEEEIANRDALADFRDWIPFLLDRDRTPRVP